MRKTAAALLIASLPLPALAQDTVKDGKWEFVTTTKVPDFEMPELPEGVELPPGIEMGSAGPKITHTQCITKEQLVPQNQQDTGDCTLEDVKRSGNTVKWKVACKSEDGTMTGEGSATYTGETMKSEMRMKGNSRGQAIDMTQTTVGRYLGACDK